MHPERLRRAHDQAGRAQATLVAFDLVRLDGDDQRLRPLDARAGVTGWTLHDLRRTARSLMSRAGVSTDHAERVIGYEGIYDRHTYREEKRIALAKLATLIDNILNPRGNVAPLAL